MIIQKFRGDGKTCVFELCFKPKRTSLLVFINGQLLNSSRFSDDGDYKTYSRYVQFHHGSYPVIGDRIQIRYKRKKKK